MPAENKASQAPLLILGIVTVLAIMTLLAVGNYSRHTKALLLTSFCRDATKTRCWQEEKCDTLTGKAAAQCYVTCRNRSAYFGGCSWSYDTPQVPPFPPQGNPPGQDPIIDQGTPPPAS